MEVNQLKIGNYVKGNVVYSNRPYVTFERFNEKLDVAFFSDGSTHGIGEYLKDLSGIPLTEEWLLKFGFYIDSFKNYELGNINIHRLTFKLDIFEEDDWHTIPIKMKYVHQLQNLYFALTGEELTIKQD